MIALWLPLLVLLVTGVWIWGSPWLFSSNLPPGPKPWPIVGNILEFPKSGFVRLAEKYGPIYTFWMGLRPMIIVTGTELMQDALIDQAGHFSDRCTLYSHKHWTCNFKTVASASGTVWRELRRNLVQEVLSLTRLRSDKPVRDLEFWDLVQSLRKQARDNDGVVKPLPSVRRTIFNVLNTMCFGEGMEENVVREIDDLVADRFRRFGGSMADYIYLWRIFDIQKVDEVKASIARMNELVRPTIVKTRLAMKNGEPASSRYVETLLRIQEKEGRKRFTDENIVALCSEVLHSGTDTTAHTAEWILARLVAHQEVQQRLAEEMEAVLGEKTIDESDIDRLPYLRAVVKETQRMDGTYVFAVPHAVSQSGVKLGGFDISKRALIMFRLHSGSHDPEIWDDPQNFRPQRFLGNMADVDIIETKKMTLVPFGAGERTCPGMNLALLQLHMIVGLLVQNFEWTSGEPGEVDLQPDHGSIIRMKTSLKACIRERESSSALTKTFKAD